MNSPSELSPTTARLAPHRRAMAAQPTAAQPTAVPSTAVGAAGCDAGGRSAGVVGRILTRARAVGPALVVSTLVLAGCTGGPGDRDEFVDVLRLDDGFTENESICIADAVFEQYGDDEEALGKISGAESYEWLIGEEGVVGFEEFFSGVVADCTTVGPSPQG